MSKKVFIYYSLSGNGDIVADYLKRKGIAIRKVITKEPLPKNRILQILAGGYKAMINYHDKLKDFDNDVNDYDEVIIGSPIWNGRVSSPINTVLDKLNVHNKKVSFIFYSGSGQAPRALKSVRDKYPACRVLNIKGSRKDIQTKTIDGFLAN